MEVQHERAVGAKSARAIRTAVYVAEQKLKLTTKTSKTSTSATAARCRAIIILIPLMDRWCRALQQYSRYSCSINQGL